MQFTQRQRPAWGRWRPFLAAIPVGLLLGFLGPFGSYPAYPTATRYAFWLGLTAAGVDSACGGALRGVGVAVLAVPMPGQVDPAENERTMITLDQNRLFTTAAVVAALATSAGSRRSIRCPSRPTAWR